MTDLYVLKSELSAHNAECGQDYMRYEARTVIQRESPDAPYRWRTTVIAIRRDGSVERIPQDYKHLDFIHAKVLAAAEWHSTTGNFYQDRMEALNTHTELLRLLMG